MTEPESSSLTLGGVPVRIVDRPVAGSAIAVMKVKGEIVGWWVTEQAARDHFGDAAVDRYLEGRRR